MFHLVPAVRLTAELHITSPLPLDLTMAKSLPRRISTIICVFSIFVDNLLEDSMYRSCRVIETMLVGFFSHGVYPVQHATTKHIKRVSLYVVCQQICTTADQRHFVLHLTDSKSH